MRNKNILALMGETVRISEIITAYKEKEIETKTEKGRERE